MTVKKSIKQSNEYVPRNIPYSSTDMWYELNREEFDKKAESKFKLGDFGIYEMNVFQITNISKDTGNPCSVSDGCCEIYTRNINEHTFFPLTLRNKNLADDFKEQYDKLSKYSSLNFPDLHRYYVQECNRAILSNEATKTREIYQDIVLFTKNVIDLCSQKENHEINGVSIFRKI